MSEGRKRPLWLEITVWGLAFLLLLLGVFTFTHFRASCANDELEDTVVSFHVEDKDGNVLRLADCEGKPVVVDFWAIWCAPCKRELPDMQEAYEEYGDEVTFLFINVLRWQGNSVAEVEGFMSEKGYSFPVYYDTDGKAATACHVSSIPLTLFIGKDGRVKKTYSGTISSFVLKNYIQDIL